MPVVQKTDKRARKQSARKPTTVTIGARPRPVKRAPAPAKAEAARSRKSGKDHGGLPSWRQLESKENRRQKGMEDGSPILDAISTVRFALILALVAAAFTLYVGHVHGTEDLLAATQRARQENHRLHLKYNRLKGEFDRLTGPEEIYRRARTLGLVSNTTFGPTIIIED